MSFLSKLNELFGKKPVAVEKPVELKKRTMKLVSRKELVDLGVTYVLLKFSDGRELVKKVYGKGSQITKEGNDEGIQLNVDLGYTIYHETVTEPSVSNLEIITSVKRAEDYLIKLSKQEQCYQDCPRVPTKSEVGKVITATILRTESNLEEVTKYSVEKI